MLLKIQFSFLEIIYLTIIVTLQQLTNKLDTLLIINKVQIQVSFQLWYLYVNYQNSQFHTAFLRLKTVHCKWNIVFLFNGYGDYVTKFVVFVVLIYLSISLSLSLALFLGHF